MEQVWREVIGYPDYIVSNIGNVKRATVDRRNRRPRELTATINGRGYFCVGLCRGDERPRTIAVHKLVAEAFIGPRPAEYDGVDHTDRDKLNNDASNLRYATAQQQTANRRKNHDPPSYTL